MPSNFFGELNDHEGVNILGVKAVTGTREFPVVAVNADPYEAVPFTSGDVVFSVTFDDKLCLQVGYSCC